MFLFQAEDGIRDAQESRGLGDVYKRQGLEILISHAGAGLTTGEQKRLPGLLLGEQAEPPAGIGDFGALREAARLLRESGGHWWVKSKPGGLTDWRALFPIEADAQPEPPENN